MASKKPPTFEEIRELFQEVTEKFKETDAKFKETERLIKSNARDIGGLSEKWGDLGEAMTIGEILPLFNSIDDIEVDNLLLNREQTRKGKKRELDGIATGDNMVIVIEAKASLQKGHVESFINKTLKRFLEFVPIYTGRKIYGAIGYLSASSAAKNFAQEQGLLLICPTQRNKKLVSPPKGFKLRNFHP